MKVYFLKNASAELEVLILILVALAASRVHPAPLYWTRALTVLRLSIIDRTNEEQALVDEQQTLDDTEDQVSELSVRIQRLITLAAASTDGKVVQVATKQLRLSYTKLDFIDAAVRDVDDAEEDVVCTLEEHRDQVTEVKTELATLKASLLSFDVAADNPIMQEQARTEKAAFDCILRIKKRLRVLNATTTKLSESPATKLPKLELPTFHGDILRWKNFWEQFCVSVHDRTNIPKEEKLMYLQNTIKDKTAKSLIAGLTKSSEHYDEAVKCLQERYDRPRQIHQTHVRPIVKAQTHVRPIVKATPLRDGTGKEIRALHDLVVQHLRALKSLGHEPSQAFITSLLEVKLDSTIERQRHSQAHADVPDYQELLDFLNLRAQAAEASTNEKRASKPVNSMVINATPRDNCISCGTEKHQYQVSVSLSCREVGIAPIQELLPQLPPSWSLSEEMQIAQPL